MATNQNQNPDEHTSPNPEDNRNSKHATDKNWHAQQNQAIPNPQNTHQPGHAQNKDQLNRLTERKDNHNKNTDAHGNNKG